MAGQKQDEQLWTYMQQLCEGTGCSPEDLPEAMNDREKWWERAKDIRAGGMMVMMMMMMILSLTDKDIKKRRKRM